MKNPKTAELERKDQGPQEDASLPEIANPPYRTRLGRANVSQSVKAVFQNELRKERDTLVLEHLPLVKAIALRVHENLPVVVDLDDLVHAGVLGLFDAVNKYEPDKKVAFSSYAKHRIKGAILDSLRNLDWASRDQRRRQKQVEAITRDLAVKLKRSPTEEELAAKMGVDMERWRQEVFDLRGLSPATMQALEPALPSVATEDAMLRQADPRCGLRDTIQRALASLLELDRTVVLLYYSNDMTMEEIGALLGLDESLVSQMHKSALERMAAALGIVGAIEDQGAQ